MAFCWRMPGCIELTWNHGTESEPGSAEHGGRVYNSGNGDTAGTPDNAVKVRGGFGHIGITVPNVYTACARFKELCGGDGPGDKIFHKSPNGGGMKGLAFIKDPDGYLIEVIAQGPQERLEVDCCGVRLDGASAYKDNSK